MYLRRERRHENPDHLLVDAIEAEWPGQVAVLGQFGIRAQRSSPAATRLAAHARRRERPGASRRSRFDPVELRPKPLLISRRKR